MASTSFTNLITLTDAAWMNQVDTVAYAYLTSVSGTNTITATGPVSMTAYAAGQKFHFIPAATNTGATTANITPSGGAALGAKNIFLNGVALIGGELAINVPAVIEYDGTQFNLLNPNLATIVACLIGASAQIVSSNSRLQVKGVTGNAAATFQNDTAGVYSQYIHNTATAGDNQWAVFGTEASFTSRGSITYNRGGGLTAYNTTSDYRLKDLYGDYAGSGLIIDSVTVHLGKMKGAAMQRPMFVAHEVQAVAPWAVTGEKDAITEDGEIIPQQLSESSLVAVLWSEVRALRARIAALEAK